MAGLNGVGVPAAFGVALGPLLEGAGITFTPGGGAQFVAAWLWIAALMALAFLAPTTRELVGPALDGPPAGAEIGAAGRLPRWRPSRGWALATAAAAAAGVLALPQVTEFLYFQF
jgi:hypothetical protein